MPPTAPAWTLFNRPPAADDPAGPADPAGSLTPPWTLGCAPTRLRRHHPPHHPRPAPPPRGHLAWPETRRRDRSGELLSARYELLRRLGSGGMADVYAARFLASRRPVAVKLLDPLLAGDLELVARFRHEFLILTRVDHRHLITASDMAVTETGEPYFAMELIPGPTLEGSLGHRGRLDPAAVITLGRQLCGATAALHHAGVIHRDIKPTNVLLAPAPAETLDARLIDLGIAWRSPAYHATPEAYATPPADRLRTAHGCVLGTPGYTPPEAGHEACAPTHDVFALGVVLYRAWTGCMPFCTPYGALHGDRPRPISELPVTLPPAPALEEVLLAALSPDPRLRLPSAEALAQELDLAHMIDIEVGGEAA